MMHLFLPFKHPRGIKEVTFVSESEDALFFLYFHFEIQSISEVLCYAPVPRVHGLHKHFRKRTLDLYKHF